MARKKKRSSSKSFIKIFISLCIVFAIVYYAVSFFIIKPHIFYPGFNIQLPNGYEIHGIDVSRYQQTINWEEVKDMEVKGVRIKFAFIKATEGGSHVDAQFRQNWLNAGMNQMTKGAYHFFIPGRNALRQAKNFIQIVELKKGDLPPVLDVEIEGRISVKEMRENVKLWLDEVEKEFGVKPVIYTNIYFFHKYFEKGFEDYPLWIAHYLEPDKPRLEQKWIFWQHSETGTVNGIKSKVDFNVFYGDQDDFDNLLIP